MIGWEKGARGSATLTEILSQPETWRQCLRELHQSGVIQEVLEETKSRTEWMFIGCGTSFYLAEAAAASWSTISGGRAHALPASDILLFPRSATRARESTQAVVISRSGRTSEAVKAAQVLSKEYRIPTLGITCAAGSQLEEACDRTIRLPAADEKSMVMTRSFSSMLLALQVLASHKSGETGLASTLEGIADHFARYTQPLAEQVEAFVARHSFADYVFLGQGPFHA